MRVRCVLNLFVILQPASYKHHLALIVVVDKENITHIAMQALLANERTEDFQFLFRSFRQLIGGAQPQVSQVSMCSGQLTLRCAVGHVGSFGLS